MLKTYGEYDRKVAKRKSEVPLNPKLKTALLCPVCQRWLIKIRNVWVCWKGHSKITSDVMLRDEIVRIARESRIGIPGDYILDEFLMEQKREEA